MQMGIEFFHKFLLESAVSQGQANFNRMATSSAINSFYLINYVKEANHDQWTLHEQHLNFHYLQKLSSRLPLIV